MIIELNEQQVDLVKYFLERVIQPLENYGETTKAVATQIIDKLNEEE